MKRTILLLLATALSSIAFGQEIPDYLDEGKFWSIYCTLVTPDEPTYMEYNWFEGSDTINGVIWKKLFSAGRSDLQDKRFSGWYRQEGKKVYERREWANGDELIMLHFDFGAQEGDTVFVHNSEYQVVDRVFDTVFDPSDGKPRRCFEVRFVSWSNGSKAIDKNFWVEGIGSLNLGIAASWISYDGSWSELLCCKKDDTLWYQNALYNTCSIEILGPDTLSNRQSVKNPLPVKVRVENHRAFFTISPLVSEKTVLDVFNLMGQKLFSNHFQHGEASTPYLPADLYIYRISPHPTQGKNNTFSAATGKIRIPQF